MRERELEQAMREGLTALAAEADVAPPTVRRVVERARDGVGRRRRSGWTVAVAAAAAVVVAGGVAVVRDAGQRQGEPAPGDTSNPPVEAPDVPGGYRIEYWHDVAVYVPATWGWGSAPMEIDGEAQLCSAGQIVQADGSRREQASQPYVGRPIMLSDVCMPWAHERPQAPYVWLGGDVPAGTVDLGGGWVRETVEVGDVPVSVATDDPALRRAIVASAHQVSGECKPSLWNPPEASGTTDPGFVPVSMTVCAYLSTESRLDYDLAYEQELSMGPAKGLVAAVDSAPSLGSSSCLGASGGDWALLRLRGEGGAFRDYAVDMSCPSIADPTGTQHQLTGEVVSQWAVGGINALLHRHPSVQAPDRFIPPPG